jgi:hypothetical protein
MPIEEIDAVVGAKRLLDDRAPLAHVVTPAPR